MNTAATPPESVVVDASFVLRYVLHVNAPRPAADGLLALRECELLVPGLWNAEVANALVQAERRSSAAPDRIGQALTAILALSPLVDAQPVDMVRILESARSYRLSAYDALYIELAVRRRAALATFDTELIAAAPRAGVRLYPDTTEL